MFNKSVGYAINLLNVMPAVGETASAKELAKLAKVPAAYSSKVIQMLRNAGIVASTRGVGGGATLLKPLNKVSVGDVLDAVVGNEAPKKGTPAAKKAEELRKYLTKVMVK
jgi:Rrf2 family protein